MSPEKAQVYIAEDNTDYQEAYGWLLTKEGHEVVGVAATVKEAEEFLSNPEVSDQVQVALLDGNLGDFNRGADGKYLAELIVRLNEGRIARGIDPIYIVSVSGGSVPGYKDAVVSKAEITYKLAETVRNLGN